MERAARRDIAGTPSRNIAAPHFVHFLQNHDQVANSARRPANAPADLAGPASGADGAAAARAADADAVHGAGVCGVEPVSCTSPIMNRSLAALVRTGRPEFMSQFPRLEVASTASRELADPADPKHVSCMQTRLERGGAKSRRDCDCTATCSSLRREDRVFSRQDQTGDRRLGDRAGGVRAALVRRRRRRSADAVQPGTRLRLASGRRTAGRRTADRARWQLLWSSEDPRYGGMGTPQFDEEAVARSGPHGGCVRGAS